ncbi:MAG: signal recognition particle-docking protein FtsY, partial [Anaerolineae bacterium]
KQVHRAPHETLLVLDATTGQNALSQAKVFTETAGVTGVVLAKLDSSSKGGMVFAIGRELGLPVLFIATGEQPDDFAPFDPAAFVDALFAED